MKLRIIVTLITVFSSLLLGRYTAAIFTASNRTPEHIFVTGAININSYRGGFDTVSGPMFYFGPEEGQTKGIPAYSGVKPTHYWVPGDSNTRSLIVYNRSSCEVMLKQVRAQCTDGDETLANQMDVAIYRVYPPENQTARFMTLKGDETNSGDIVDYFTRTLNQAILRDPNGHFPYMGISQEEIEQMIEEDSGLLWTGGLKELCTGFQDFTSPVVLAESVSGDSYGCILAFKIRVNPEAGNEYQDLSTCFKFQVKALSMNSK